MLLRTHDQQPHGAARACEPRSTPLVAADALLFPQLYASSRSFGCGYSRDDRNYLQGPPLRHVRPIELLVADPLSAALTSSAILTCLKRLQGRHPRRLDPCGTLFSSTPSCESPLVRRGHHPLLAPRLSGNSPRRQLALQALLDSRLAQYRSSKLTEKGWAIYRSSRRWATGARSRASSRASSSNTRTVRSALAQRRHIPADC